MQPEESWFGAKGPGGASRWGTLEMASWERDTGVALLEGEDCWAFPLDTGGESVGFRGSPRALQRSSLLCRCSQVRAEAWRPAAAVSPGPLFVYLPSESL